ncbi:MAG: squalene synthase HpnC [Proteobacteria bacterium]|nr:squalene synthase HpnC [Pseudomonadota bacterium]
MTGATVETPSGKNAAYENFPVGSWLLPAALRPHVAAYYRFARAIDDIADNPTLLADEKISRLHGFADALSSGSSDRAFETAYRMRESLAETGVDPRHCLDLVDAFKQDAVKNRYDDWDDLIDYCLRSAAPVGRYLIELHGGSRHGFGPSDALCNALQVINHLQDCRDDFLSMDRVYLPQDWMAEAGASVDMLAADKTSPSLRQVIDRCLDRTRELMQDARRLPSGLKSRRLAMESAAIVRIADALIEKLARHDPLAARVKLSKPHYACCIFRGAAVGAFA